jgi:hypothetical protein
MLKTIRGANRSPDWAIYVTILLILIENLIITPKIITL